MLAAGFRILKAQSLNEYKQSKGLESITPPRRHQHVPHEQNSACDAPSPDSKHCTDRPQREGSDGLAR